MLYEDWLHRVNMEMKSKHQCETRHIQVDYKEMFDEGFTVKECLEAIFEDH